MDGPSNQINSTNFLDLNNLNLTQGPFETITDFALRVSYFGDQLLKQPSPPWSPDYWEQITMPRIFEMFLNGLQKSGKDLIYKSSLPEKNTSMFHTEKIINYDSAGEILLEVVETTEPVMGGAPLPGGADALVGQGRIGLACVVLQAGAAYALVGVRTEPVTKSSPDFRSFFGILFLFAYFMSIVNFIFKKWDSADYLFNIPNKIDHCNKNFKKENWTGPISQGTIDWSFKPPDFKTFDVKIPLSKYVALNLNPLKLSNSTIKVRPLRAPPW